MDTQEIRDLVEDATRHHGAPWKRVVSSDGSFYGVTDRNGAVVAGSPAVTALIAQAPTLIPELLDRLEQAEQAVQRVREVHRPVDVEPSETICHACSTVRGNGESLRYFPYKEWPCETIRALDGETRRAREMRAEK